MAVIDAAPTRVFQDIPLDRVVAERNTRREFTAEHIDRLAESMNQFGLQSPIQVRRDGDRFVLVAGECRTRAARQIGWETILAEVVDVDVDTADAGTIIENSVRQGLNPVEEAQAIRRFLDGGWDLERVMAAFGRKKKWVEDRLALLDIVPEAQRLIEQGSQFGPDFGVALRGLDPNLQHQAMQAFYGTGPMASSKGAEFGLTIYEFREVCARLRALMEQTPSMFEDGFGLSQEDFQMVVEEARGKAPKTATQIAEVLGLAATILEHPDQFSHDKMAEVAAQLRRVAGQGSWRRPKTNP